jgi:hypothetical protein
MDTHHDDAGAGESGATQPEQTQPPPEQQQQPAYGDHSEPWGPGDGAAGDGP